MPLVTLGSCRAACFCCLLALVRCLCVSLVARLLSCRCFCWACCCGWLRAVVLALRCLRPPRAAGVLCLLAVSGALLAVCCCVPRLALPARCFCAWLRALVGSVVCVAAAVVSAWRLRARCLLRAWVFLLFCFWSGVAVLLSFALLRPGLCCRLGADWMTSSLNMPSRTECFHIESRVHWRSSSTVLHGMLSH